jgi:hypothetical protein
MKAEHHASTLESAIELLDLWRNKPHFELSKDLLNVLRELISEVHIKRLKEWVAQTDEIGDVIVTDGLASKIIDRVSKATCFQHFAYSGLLGELRSGNSVIKKYDGYCWDCDPYLKWYKELANVSWEDVKYNEKCGIFTPEILQGSPGARKILGNKDWDDQIYPSAIELSEFYGNNSINLKDDKTSFWAIQSLCFSIHLLQDLAIPQHVLCTIELDHSGYEQEIYEFWKNIYSERSKDKKNDVLNYQVSERVLYLLKNDLSGTNTFKEIGEWAVDKTCNWLKNTNNIPSRPNKEETLRITIQGIACTIKAFSLYVGKNIIA